MATNKNQHFVPRCYLKPFSNNGEGKAIRVFNLDREQIIENAAVKHQCSGSYFYGENERLETAIQSIEQKYAGALLRVRSPSYNDFLVKDELILKRFWLLQYLRTEAASKRAVEMSNDLVKLAGAGYDFNLEIRDAVQMAMHAFANEMRVIDDLKVCLIKNATSFPFVTSDDPAVFNNKWFKSDRRHLGSGFGLRSSGVLAFLPLCENTMFIAYDSDVYSIPKNSGIIKIKREEDVYALNQLQFLNSRANVFPGQRYSRKLLCDAYRSCEENRLNVRHAFHYAVFDGVEKGQKRYRVVGEHEHEGHQEILVHSQNLFPSPKSWPILLQWRKKGFGMTNGTGVGCIRRTCIDSLSEQPFEKMYTGR
ncbi:DUF4238 domain-containing protein [Vreelandella piezotolerans]|uniref:DUF4238 domain-containing protein n=1 Tax=Vreelandella piezotolerans TaxID=2609667 RepID=UPI0014449E5B|nr:DUF4238 domain-containing protein [Halomonas piezotolerans]QJA25445.1 DUF4238 domain-containing protein [Halomonas piezotolerans]